jgi:hypothetical protein
MPAILVGHRYRVRPVRRLLVITTVLLACSAPARAGVPLHTGRPALPETATPHRLLDYRHALIGLDLVRGPDAAFAIRQAGGRLIDPQIQLWSVPSHAAARMLPGLRAAGIIRSVTPDYPLRQLRASRSLSLCTDPLCQSEWWLHAVGADVWNPPGPGVPVTMIDSGVDLTHPEFAGRPDTTALNTQTFNTTEDELHGTATASMVAAPQNGAGVVGIYPQAKLQIWDASPAGLLTVGGEIDGLASALRHGRGVINLSLGGFDRITIEEHAILAAFGAGSLIVASAGNDRQEGSPRSFPASFAHVLTIGATDETNRATDFSSSSPDMDLVAPGQDMQVAIPAMWCTPNLPCTNGYGFLDGTSFSAPLVSGAAAAVWTVRPTLSNTQLFEVIRRSAHQVSGRGWNRNTGYGILDVNAALARKAPGPDPQEPNEDVYLVKPNGLFKRGHPRIKGVLAAHLEQGDDPEDVYRAYVPAHGRLTVTLRPSANVNLEVWGPKTRTVFERGTAARRDLLGASAHRGSRTERVVARGGRAGQYVYVDAFLAKSVREAGYTLNVVSARR